MSDKIFIFAVASAVPLKKDDTPKLKEEGERFASDRLEVFKNAAENNEDLTTFFKDLLEYVKKAQTNNKKLTTGIKVIAAQLKLITILGINPASSLQLHALAWTIDGNRDNVSYYVLDYAAKWVQNRLDSVSDTDVKAKMQVILDNIVTARDTLDANAQIFVKGIKDIKEWTHLGRGMGHARQIKQIIKDIGEGSKDTTLIEKTDSAVSDIAYLAGY